MRLLGIDYGAKKIGLALSDESAILAFPHSVILNKGIGRSADEISQICAKLGVSKIVLGRSFDYKRRPNPIMSDILKFKKILEEDFNIDVCFEDEFSSTREAKTLISKDDLGRRASRARLSKKRIKKTVDAEAAAIILKNYIDRQNMLK